MEKLRLTQPAKRRIIKFLLNSVIIVAGNALAAAATSFFIIPNGFVMGGTTGLGIFVRNLLSEDLPWRDWAVSVTVYAANILLFVIGVILLGKRFAAGTLAGTLLYPTFVSIFTYAEEQVEKAYGSPLGVSPPMGNYLLAAVIGALCFGLGVGIVIRVGASTGGTDIPPLIFQKFFGWSVSVSLWIIDAGIILLQFVAHVRFEAVLYGVLITLINSIVISKVSPIGMRRTQVKIISSRYLEIREVILNKISRGVTILYGQTGYLEEECHVLLTVISHRQLVTLKAEVHKIDPNAFMTISEVSEVRGRGFRSDGVDFLMPAHEEGDIRSREIKHEEKEVENDQDREL